MEAKDLKWVAALVIWAWLLQPAGADNAGQDAIPGTPVNITGEFTCTFCHLKNPAKAGDAECCRNCVRTGDPPLLTDPGGNHYVLLTGEHEVSLMTPERYEMLGGAVTVTGVLVQGKGVQAIYVDQIVAR
jgi:hypothetical protein